MSVFTVFVAAFGAIALARRAGVEHRVPIMVSEALARLADGDTSVRLFPAFAGRDSRTASLFNALARTLEFGAGEAIAETRDAPLREQADLLCVAVASIAHFVQLRHQIGSATARRTLQHLQGRVTELIPGAALGRVGRSTIEFRLPVTDEEAAGTLLAALVVALEKPVAIDGQRLELTVTIGCACGPQASPGELMLLEHAEVALDRALATNRRVAIFSSEDEADVDDRVRLARDLGGAGDRGEFFLSYQPKVTCRTEESNAAEALIRWQHPVRGLIGPNAFIPIAETTGGIRAITRWVLTQALADQRRLADEGLPIEISVNISGRLLGDPEFARWALAEASQAVAPLTFEITETMVIEDPERAVEHLDAFAAAGIRIAIDDYGSGLSSLTYLKQLPANELKIDRLFVSGLASSHRDPLLVRSSIDLAHALDMQVTAEGVDSQATLALLTMMGCDHVQGFLIAKPMRLDDLITFLRNGRQSREGNEAPSLFRKSSFWRSA